MTKQTASSSADALRDFPVPSRPKAGAVANSAASDVAGDAPVGAPQCLSPEEIAALSLRREARWRPGLADQPLHSEIFASARDASGAGLAMALARDALQVAASADDALAQVYDRRHVLWVQDARAIRLGGRPYLHGLPRDWRERLIHVEATTPEDALFALEEGLRCRDLACVIGEIAGNPRALDFTASRRLSLAAEKHGTALWLVRLEAQAELSSARMRWRAVAAPSKPPPWNAQAPGSPSWSAELFRARSHAPGEWIVSDDEARLAAHTPSARYSVRNTRNAFHAHSERPTQPFGPALARQRRIQHAAAGGNAAPDSGHLVRATFGRSLAACARM